MSRPLPYPTMCGTAQRVVEGANGVTPTTRRHSAGRVASEDRVDHKIPPDRSTAKTCVIDQPINAAEFRDDGINKCCRHGLIKYPHSGEGFFVSALEVSDIVPPSKASGPARKWRLMRRSAKFSYSLPEPSRGARDDDYFAGEISYHFRVFLYVACIRDIFVIILFVI